MADVVFDRCSGIDLSVDSSLANPTSAMVAHNVVLTDGKISVRRARRKLANVSFVNPPTGMARVAVDNTPITLVVANTSDEEYNHLYKMVYDVTTNQATATELKSNSTSVQLSKTKPSKFIELGGEVVVTDGELTYRVASLTADTALEQPTNTLSVIVSSEENELAFGGISPGIRQRLLLWNYSATQTWLPKYFNYGAYTPGVADGDRIYVKDDTATESYWISSESTSGGSGEADTETNDYVYHDLLLVDANYDLSAYASLIVNALNKDGTYFDALFWQVGLGVDATTWSWYSLGIVNPDTGESIVDLTTSDPSTRRNINYIGIRYIGPGGSPQYYLRLKSIFAYGNITGMREYYFLVNDPKLGKSIPDKRSTGYMVVNAGDKPYGSHLTFFVDVDTLNEGATIDVFRTIVGVPYELETNISAPWFGHLHPDYMGFTPNTGEGTGWFTFDMVANHGLETGDYVSLNHDGSPPSGLATLETYFPIIKLDANSFKIFWSHDEGPYASLDETKWEISVKAIKFIDKEWDGDIIFNDTLDILRSSTPAAKAIASWRGCLWMGNTKRKETDNSYSYEPMSLYKSEVANPLHFSTDQFPLNPNDAMRICLDSSISGTSSNYHNEIVALVALPEMFLNELLVFTTRGVFAVRGNDTTDFQVRQVSLYGCKASQSVAITPSGAMWLSHEGLVTYPDNAIIPQVRPIVDGSYPYYLEGTPYAGVKWGEEALGFYANQKYRLYSNDGTGIGLVYDFNSGTWTSEDIQDAHAVCVQNLPGDNNEVFVSYYDGIEASYRIAALDDANELSDSSDTDENGLPLDQIHWVYIPHWQFGQTIQSWFFKKGYIAVTDSPRTGRHDNSVNVQYYVDRDVWSETAGDANFELVADDDPSVSYQVYELRTKGANVKGNEFGVLVQGYARPGFKIIGIHLFFESAGIFGKWTD